MPESSGLETGKIAMRLFRTMTFLALIAPLLVMPQDDAAAAPKKRKVAASHDYSALSTVGIYLNEITNELEQQRDLMNIYNLAKQALVDGNRSSYATYHRQMQDLSYDSFSNDPSERLDKLRMKLLESLPKRFVPNVAIVLEDGTVACDPDPSVRLQLQKDEYNIRFSSDNF